MANNFFSRIEFYTSSVRKVKMLVGRLHSPKLRDGVWLEDSQFIFLIFHTFVCKKLLITGKCMDKLKKNN